jgi:hypothetical protein
MAIDCVPETVVAGEVCARAEDQAGAAGSVLTLAEVRVRSRPDERPVASRRWSARRLVQGALVGILLAAAVQLFQVTLGGNFHEVIAGDVYRSAQPTAQELQTLIRRYQIRTVVNLRGDNAEDDWYWEEKRTAEQNGAVMVDVGLYGNVPPEAEQLKLLVHTLDHARPPFLLHCYSGADRAGMASVMALLLRTDADLPEARRQLAWWLGHNPLGHAGCHDRLFDRYEEWLRARQQTHAPRHLQQWVRDIYRPEMCQ